MRIKTANRNVERLATAERELKRLLGEAEQREAVAAVEQRAAEGRGAREALINLYSDADSHAAALADILARIGAAREVIREANRATLDAGRRDLKVTDPVGDLAHLVGAATADSLPNPMGWSISGYWPLRDGAGNSVGAGRPLARIRELASTQERPRKAA